MTTNPCVAIARCEDQAEEYIAPVTSILGKPLTGYIGRTELGDTNEFLSYGSLLVEQFDSEATVTRQLFPFAWLPISRALQQATQDIRTSGAPVISLFASIAWRLLIASKTISLPSVSGGASFASVQPETLIVLTAKLFAQQAKSKASSSRVINAWRVVVPADNEEATSSFVSTAVRLSHRALTGSSRGSH